MMFSLIKKIRWYLRKHGFIGLCQLITIKLWRRTFNNKEAVFVCDLINLDNDSEQSIEGLTVDRYVAINDIPDELLSKLIKIKSEEVLIPFFRSFFDRKAVLWLAKIGPEVAGLQWILVGGFKGFYSLPIPPYDAIVLAVEIFPDFRGRGIWPAMSNIIFSRLRESGISRVYTKIGTWNTSSLRSIAKTKARRIGTAMTFSIFGKHITIWDKAES